MRTVRGKRLPIWKSNRVVERFTIRERATQPCDARISAGCCIRSSIAVASCSGLPDGTNAPHPSNSWTPPTFVATMSCAARRLWRKLLHVDCVGEDPALARRNSLHLNYRWALTTPARRLPGVLRRSRLNNLKRGRPFLQLPSARSTIRSTECPMRRHGLGQRHHLMLFPSHPQRRQHVGDPHRPCFPARFRLGGGLRFASVVAVPRSTMLEERVDRKDAGTENKDEQCREPIGVRACPVKILRLRQDVREVEAVVRHA
jgi:hypothetical protein